MRHDPMIDSCIKQIARFGTTLNKSSSEYSQYKAPSESGSTYGGNSGQGANLAAGGIETASASTGFWLTRLQLITDQISSYYARQGWGLILVGASVHRKSLTRRPS